MYHKGARTTTSSSSVTARSVAFYHRLGSSPPAGKWPGRSISRGHAGSGPQCAASP